MTTPGDIIRSIASQVGFGESLKGLSPLRSQKTADQVSPLRPNGASSKTEETDTYHRRIAQSLAQVDSSEPISSALPTLAKYLGGSTRQNEGSGFSTAA